MTTIVSTEIIIVPTDTSYTVPGDFSAAMIVSNYSANIPGLASMASSETTEVRANGTVKIVTFTTRTGTKGLEA